MKRLSFIFIMGVALQPVCTQRLLTCDQAIAIALGESYTIRSHVENMRAMEYSYLYYKAQFKPRLDFNLYAPQWSENVAAVEQPDGLPVYNSTGDMRFGSDLSFTYVLPTGGNLSLNSTVYHQQITASLAEQNYLSLKRQQAFSQFGIWFNQPLFTKNQLRENLRVAEFQYAKSRCTYTRTQMDIIFHVTDAFYLLYKMEYQRNINEERFRNSEETCRIARLKLETGDLPEAEVMISEVNMEQDHVRLLESVSTLETLEDKFKMLIGLDLRDSVDIQVEMEFESVRIDLQTAIDQALQRRLEISETDLDIRLQEIEVDRARREREIKGNLQAFYDFTGVSTRTDNLRDRFASSFENITQRPANRGIVFAISVPLIDWGRGKNKTRQAEAQLRLHKLYAEDLQRHIEQEVRQIVRTVQDAESRVRINRRNAEVATHSYKVAQMRFQNGDIGSQELSLEQDRLYGVQLAFIESFITYRMALTDLKRKTLWDFENNRSYTAENN